jgi:hypothetical protein
VVETFQSLGGDTRAHSPDQTSLYLVAQEANCSTRYTFMIPSGIFGVSPMLGVHHLPPAWAIQLPPYLMGNYLFLEVERNQSTTLICFLKISVFLFFWFAYLFVKLFTPYPNESMFIVCFFLFFYYCCCSIYDFVYSLYF